VYHALAIHDRLWCFQPCHALRDVTNRKYKDKKRFQIHERWFPGCHYDIGRQRFRFLRNGQNWIERAVGQALGGLTEAIEPNHVLGDLVLIWMLESIKTHSPNEVVPEIDDKINTSRANMRALRQVGSGDVYDNILRYGPLGQAWDLLVRPNLTPLEPITNIPENINDTMAMLGPLGLLCRDVFGALLAIFGTIFNIINGLVGILTNIPFIGPVFGPLQLIMAIPVNLLDDFLNLFAPLGIIWRDLITIFSSLFMFQEFRIIVDVLAQRRDRRISDSSAAVAKYNEADNNLGDSVVVVKYDEEEEDLNNTIEHLASINTRYPSQTYRNFLTYLNAMR
ncbi:hypothetical protein BGZ89_006874, partial [Linnemannia elongata]